MAAAAPIIAIAGTAVSAAGSIAQGLGAASEARYQAQVARNNAKIAEVNAQYASAAGAREEEAYRIKATNLRATQKAGFATSGVDVNVGSPFRVQLGSKILENLDAATIRNNTMRKVYDARSQGMQLEAQAGLYEKSANNAVISGVMEGASTLLSGASSVAPKWNTWRSPTPYSPPSYGPSLSSSPLTVPVVRTGGRGMSYGRA